MTTRQMVLGVLWLTLWALALGVKAQHALNPVENPEMSAEDYAELPRL